MKRIKRNTIDITCSVCHKSLKSVGSRNEKICTKCQNEKYPEMRRGFRSTGQAIWRNQPNSSIDIS